MKEQDNQRAHPSGLREDELDLPELPILLVDDDPQTLRAMTRALQPRSWSVMTADHPHQALAMLDTYRFGVVVADYRMPDMDGLTLLARVRDREPESERILATGHADEEALERGINDVAIHRVLRKPWRVSELLDVVDEAMARSRVRRERAVLLERLRQRNEELLYLNQRLSDEVLAGDRRMLLFRRRWDAALDAIGDLIVVVGPDYRVEGVNAPVEVFTGQARERLDGLGCHEVLFGRASPCPECPISGPPVRLGIERSGGEVFLDARAFSLPGERPAHLCVYRDVTQQVLLEQETAHQTKMAAIGRLASAVAHEINNPLQAILTFAQLAEKPEAEVGTVARSLHVVRESALRCRDIVKALRDFSRRDRTGPAEPVELNQLVAQVVALFTATAKHRVELSQAEGGAWCMGRPGQLYQVVVNLVQNAIDANPPQGRVRVSVELVHDQVLVAVEDEGQGVPADLRKQIFEPFFTTKPAGVGTGLGLSISHGIVADHQGSIRVVPADGGGARFELRLPAGRPSQGGGEHDSA